MQWVICKSHAVSLHDMYTQMYIHTYNHIVLRIIVEFLMLHGMYVRTYVGVCGLQPSKNQLRR